MKPIGSFSKPVPEAKSAEQSEAHASVFATASSRTYQGRPGRPTSFICVLSPHSLLGTQGE